MHETEKKVEELCRMKQKLCHWMSSKMDEGREGLNTNEAGQVVDMIKDLSEAEEKCWKACYYKSIVKAMEEEKESWTKFIEDDEGYRMGYDNYRYPSSGRFAPKGQGVRYNRMGFMMNPAVRMPGGEPWERMMDKDDMYTGYENPRMGYTGPTDTGNGNNRRYGYSYERYRDRRRNYTQTHNEKDKEEMDVSAQEHISDTITTMRDIWSHADPALKSRMKTDLSNLVGEMNS